MKISVAMCTCNGEDFIHAQIESIIRQTLPVHEIIIGDDCSTDSTVSIINEFKSKHPGLFTVVNNRVQSGSVKNFENIISKCSGDIILLSDQDDTWQLDKVRLVVDFFQQQPKALLVFTDAALIDDLNNRIAGTLWQKWGFTKELQDNWRDNKVAFWDLLNNRNKVTGATVAFRKRLIKSALPITVRKGYWHDAWLALHAAAKSGLFFIDLPLVNYRIHTGQQVGLTTTFISQQENEEAFISDAEMRKKIKRKFPRLFSTESPMRMIYKKLKNNIAGK